MQPVKKEREKNNKMPRNNQRLETIIPVL